MIVKYKWLVIIGGLLTSLGLSSCRTAFDDGYELGKSDSAKQQYNLMQSLNDADNFENQSNNSDIREYKFPAPTEVNGIKYRPRELTVRSYE